MVGQENGVSHVGAMEAVYPEALKTLKVCRPLIEFLRSISACVVQLVQI
jgi:hypothetical protein